MEHDYDPFDLDGNDRRAREKSAHGRLAVIAEEDDVAWLSTGPRGRRILQRLLRDAGIFKGRIVPSFHENFGRMCFMEGRRALGLSLFARLGRLLAAGEITPEDYRLIVESEDASTDRKQQQD